jgi:LemA protein
MPTPKNKTYLRLLIKIFVLTFFFAQPCFGQNLEDNITQAWKDLKNQLQRRADIVPNLTIALANSKHVLQNESKRARSISTHLFRILDSLQIPDSASLFFASHLNIELTGALARMLVTLEGDQDLKNTLVVRELQTNLEAVENRLKLAKVNYNNACRKAHRQDLLFEKIIKTNVPQTR